MCRAPAYYAMWFYICASLTVVVVLAGVIHRRRTRPHEVRDAFGGYWRNQVILNMGTPLEDLCLAWVAMIDGDVDEATVALQRAIGSSDAAVVAQGRETLALLHEGEDDRAAQNLYAEAAAHSTAVRASLAKGPPSPSHYRSHSPSLSRPRESRGLPPTERSRRFV